MKFFLSLGLLFFTFNLEAQLYVSPSYVDFGDVARGHSRSTSVWLRSNFSHPVQVNVSGNCMGGFSYYSNCYSLPAHGSCTLNIQFRPYREGHESCRLSVSSNYGGYTSVSASGRGVVSAIEVVNAPFVSE